MPPLTELEIFSIGCHKNVAPTALDGNEPRPDNSPVLQDWGTRRAKWKSPARDGRKVLSFRTEL